MTKMSDKKTEMRVALLNRKLFEILRREEEIEVVLSSLVGTIAKIIVDTQNDKKRGIKIAMQLGSTLSEIVSDFYKARSQGKSFVETKVYTHRL